MIQPKLAIYEDETDALKELVRELGGNKVVGNKLRPDLAVDRAAAWLKDCLSPERQERLHPSQLFMLLHLGREHQIHGPIQFIMQNIGYSITAIEPADEMAELQRAYIESVQIQRKLTERMEKLTLSPMQSLRAV